LGSSAPNTGSGKYAFKLYESLMEEVKDKNIDYYYIDKCLLKKYEKNSSVNKNMVVAKTEKIPLLNSICAPYILCRKIPKYDLYHITTQQTSFLNIYPRIITVLDIIHITHPESPFHYLLSKYVYKGLKDKNTIFIAISKYTKNDLIKHFKVSPNKIKVIYLAADKKLYKPLPKKNTKQVLQEYGLKLNENNKYILYVGSERPRKNLSTLIKALFLLKKKHNIHPVLIKVGAESHKKQHNLIKNLIQKLDLKNEVISIKNVPENDLPALYNAADLFVYPSLYEGFGLPPLEAMACGTPVITSNTSSLPEVVGDAGIMVNPYDVDELANRMYEVLTNNGLREELSKKGLERAKLFSWKKCAEETLKVYEEVYNIEVRGEK
jgi:glycosyltransferase involved in cell wall biosynthesis